MEIPRGNERPLGAVRRAVDRTHVEVVAALQGWREEIEVRLQSSENEVWARARKVQSLEGYLGRVAALLGVEVGPDPDWNEVIVACADTTDRLRELEVELAAARDRLTEAEDRARRVDLHAGAITRVAARLGRTTTDAGELLRAIDALQESAREARE